MGLLFIKTSPVKQNSYENDFSGVFDTLNQSFPVVSLTSDCHLYMVKGKSPVRFSSTLCVLFDCPFYMLKPHLIANRCAT